MKIMTYLKFLRCLSGYNHENQEKVCKLNMAKTICSYRLFYTVMEVRQAPDVFKENNMKV